MNLAQTPSAIVEKDLYKMRLPSHLHSARLVELKGSPSYAAIAKYIANIHIMSDRSKGICMVGPAQSDRLTPAAVLLRAYRLYGASCLYVHTDDLRPSPNRAEIKLLEQARASQVLLLDDLPLSPSHFSDQITSLLRRRRSGGLITLATLSVMVCLLDSTLRDVYSDAMYFLSAAPEKVWVDLELPESARVYASPSRSAAVPVNLSAQPAPSTGFGEERELVTPDAPVAACLPEERELRQIAATRPPEPPKRRIGESKEGAR